MKIKTSRLALAVALSGLLGGCASVGPWESQEVAQLETDDAQMVAGDVVEVLVSEYAPGQTTFALTNGKPGTFGMALESQLRKEGYAIVVGGEDQPVYAKNMAYILDEVGHPGTYRVGVRVAPDYRLGRLYEVNSAGALIPGSGVTIRNGSGRLLVSGSMTEASGALPLMASSRGAPPLPESYSTGRNVEKVSLDDYDTATLDDAWTVQVMAGTNRDDLERHQARLERRGREAHIVTLGTLGRLQALRLGPFDSANEARPVMREMRSDRYADAFMVEPKGGGQ